MVVLSSCCSSKVTTTTTIRERDTIINVTLPNIDVKTNVKIDSLKVKPIKISTKLENIIISLDDNGDLDINITNKDSITTPIKVVDTIINTEKVITKHRGISWTYIPFIMFIGFIFGVILLIKLKS